jgi:hypothetical protein
MVPIHSVSCILLRTTFRCGVAGIHATDANNLVLSDELLQELCGFCWAAEQGGMCTPHPGNIRSPPQLPILFGDYNRYLSPHQTVINNEGGLAFAVTPFLEIYSYKVYLFTQLMSASMA